MSDDINQLGRYRADSEVGRLRAEIVRLRGVLKKIEGLSGGGDCCSSHELLELARQIARAALAEQEKKS